MRTFYKTLVILGVASILNAATTYISTITGTRVVTGYFNETNSVTITITLDGSDAANLIKAARSLGLEAKGFKKGLSALGKVKLPVILCWEFNHFLVLEGFIGERGA